MKKLTIAAVLLIALALPVFAQQRQLNRPTPMYCFNVPVERVYLSNLGYLIQYRRSTNQIGTLGIPYEWFTDSAGRAEMVRLPAGKNWPTMSIFYNSGEFSHVRLYVHRVKSHTTWSVVQQGVDVSRFFSDPDTFDFQY